SNTQDGNTTATSINGGYDPTKNAVTIGGSYQSGNNSVGGSATFSPNETQLSGQVGVGNVKVGPTHDNIHGQGSPDTDQNKTPIQSGGSQGDVLNGANYLSTSRTDQTTIGGSLGVQAVSIAGSSTTGSRFQVFDKLPDGWDKMTDDQKAKAIKDQQA